MACKFPARVTLAIMAFFMFFVTQMIRSNLYIAIVAMVDTKQPTTDLTKPFFNPEKLQWDLNSVGIILSAFYWCYWITELPGGLLAQKYGGQRVLGIGVFVATIATFLFPTAARSGPIMASIVRAVQGLALGVTWPAMHSLSAKWIPKTERSIFMTTYHGSAVGLTITYPIFGLLISLYGWDSVFYLTGVATSIWTLLWWILIYDTPNKHPTISEAEKVYLNETVTVPSMIHNVKDSKLKTPWRSILSSKPFWAVLIASQGVIWGSVTMQMQLPSYFHQVYGLDVKQSGIFLAAPELFKFCFGIGFSSLMDYLIKNKKYSITTVRKIAVGVSEFGPALAMLLISFGKIYTARDSWIVVIIMISFTGACSSGNLANIVDIAPNFAGITLGLVKTLSVLPGVISPIIVSAIITPDGKPWIQWSWVFFITAIIQMSTSLVFFVFGSGEIQSWNNRSAPNDENGVESQSLVKADILPEVEKLENQRLESQSCVKISDDPTEEAKTSSNPSLET